MPGKQDRIDTLRAALSLPTVTRVREQSASVIPTQSWPDYRVGQSGLTEIPPVTIFNGVDTPEVREKRK